MVFKFQQEEKLKKGLHILTTAAFKEVSVSLQVVMMPRYLHALLRCLFRL